MVSTKALLAGALFLVFLGVLASGDINVFDDYDFYQHNATNISATNSTFVYITGILGCDSLDTDAKGMVICGTDATGGGGAEDKWVDNGTEISPNVTFAPNVNVSDGWIDAVEVYEGGARINLTVDDYARGVNASMDEYVDAMDLAFNSSMNTYALGVNATMTDYVNALNTSMGAYVIWVNGTMNTYALGVNGTMTTYVDERTLAYNTTMNTFVLGVNDTITVYVDAQDLVLNNSMNTFVLGVNATMKEYVDGTFLKLTGGQLNFTATTYDGTLGPTNITPCGEGEILKVSGSVWACGSDTGGSGESKWVDNGTWLTPNSTFANALNLSEIGGFLDTVGGIYLNGVMLGALFKSIGNYTGGHEGDGAYLTNTSTTMSFNETLLNHSIYQNSSVTALEVTHGTYLDSNNQSYPGDAFINDTESGKWLSVENASGLTTIGGHEALPPLYNNSVNMWFKGGDYLSVGNASGLQDAYINESGDESFIYAAVNLTQTKDVTPGLNTTASVGNSTSWYNVTYTNETVTNLAEIGGGQIYWNGTCTIIRNKNSGTYIALC